MVRADGWLMSLSGRALAAQARCPGLNAWQLMNFNLPSKCLRSQAMYCSLFSCKWQQLAVGSLTDGGDTIIVTAIVLQVLSLLGQQEVAVTSHLHIRV